ncbi:hypothetical protein SS37A_14650 [Methylocystis iwaonis]|uniref:Phage terminase small subunit P27 family n=2 Tax=Methylocystis iwaonis TaxID=2885079 RepID=A0ABN6VEB1_9HYPH|nr:hypothetical protein SS37A_14650 [Methylocystis iwaonis]
MKGRKADHPALAEAKGNPGKRRPRKTAAAGGGSGGLRPPPWLKKSREAMKVWNETAPLLIRINALTDLDRNPFARYCRYVVDWLAADAAVQAEGVFFDAIDTNGNATKKRHPAFHAREALEKTLSAIEASFGMRPDKRFEMLRNQAALGGVGFGDLFNRPPPQPDAPETDTPVKPDDIINTAARLNSAPPTRLQ